MIVKLKTKKGPLKGLESKGFGKQDVKAMVQAYRSKPGSKDALNYAHFNAYEVLQLFIANDLVSPSLSRAIQAEEASIKGFGLKIYMASHCFPLTGPLPGNLNASKYLDKNATILVNTVIDQGFWDLLDDEKSIALTKGAVDSGDGLDQSEIAPPYTITTPDPNGEQDVNNAP